jgi:hypothetical protein
MKIHNLIIIGVFLVLAGAKNSFSQNIVTPDNKILAEMSHEDFKSLFLDGKIRKGISADEVRILLGQPTEIRKDRGGRNIWQYDSTKVSVIGGFLGYTRGDKYKFAVIILDESEIVVDFKYQVR